MWVWVLSLCQLYRVLDEWFRPRNKWKCSTMNSPLTELGLLNPSLKECEDRAKILAKFAMCLFAKTCGKNPELNHPQAALHGMYDKRKKCLYMQFPGRSQIQLSGKKCSALIIVFCFLTFLSGVNLNRLTHWSRMLPRKSHASIFISYWLRLELQRIDHSLAPPFAVHKIDSEHIKVSTFLLSILFPSLHAIAQP